MRFARLDEWLHWLERSHPRAIDLGLSRVRKVANRLGICQPAPWSIVVAGTNGKGSAVAMLDALLGAAGYTTGVYTSPHIHRYNERVMVRGEPLTDDQFCESFARIDHAREDVSLTYFEFGTLAALDLINRADVDVAILEVGLGGRLDAVNIVDGDCTIVTSLGLDHQDWLGDDLEAVALEKAGIFRSGVAAVCGADPAPKTIATAARDSAARLIQYGVDYSATLQGEHWEWCFGDRRILGLPMPGLIGAMQVHNAATALTALAATPGLRMPEDSRLAGALGKLTLAGRCQKIHEQPEVIVDVAHNPQAAEALFAALETLPEKRTLAVAGMLSDKDMAGVLFQGRDRVERWYVADLPPPRGASAQALAKTLGAINPKQPVRSFNSVTQALGQALNDAAPDDRIVVFGSFLTVQAASDTMASH